MSTDGNGDRLNRRLRAITSGAAAPAAFGLKKAPPRKSDKRTGERKPAFRVGKIVYSGRNEVACVIKDYSQTGARIVLETGQALPPTVRLVVSQSGLRRDAKVIWQDGREVGIAFAETSG